MFSAELESGNAIGAFLQTPAAVLDKTSGSKGARLLSSTGLGCGNLIGRAQLFSAPALDRNRSPKSPILINTPGKSTCLVTGRALHRVIKQKHQPNRQKMSKKCLKIVFAVPPDNFWTFFGHFFDIFGHLSTFPLSELSNDLPVVTLVFTRHLVCTLLIEGQISEPECVGGAQNLPDLPFLGV